MTWSAVTNDALQRIAATIAFEVMCDSSGSRCPRLRSCEEEMIPLDPNPKCQSSDNKGTRICGTLRSLRGRADTRVTLVRTGGLGDTTLILPTLQWLQDGIPGVRVTLVGSQWAEALLPLIPYPLELVRFDSSRLIPLFAPGRAPADSAVFAKADALVVYTKAPAAEWVKKAEGACSGPVIVWPVEPSGSEHAAVHFARAVADEPLGLSDIPRPTLQVPEAMRVWGEQWLSQWIGSGIRPVAIHPGSGGPRKCWPAEHVADLVIRLAAPVLLLEGPADAEACHRVWSLLPPDVLVRVVAGISLVEAAALIAQCALYVGNDSGLTHVAGALGVPTVAVFGPTDPAVWGPLGRCVAIVGPRGTSAWPSPSDVFAAIERLARIIHEFFVNNPGLREQWPIPPAAG